jgi:hypothetical protein
MLNPIHTFIHRVGRLVFLDRAADPTANGELQRNATHVKVYSGGAVRNLSDVGAAPSHTHASHTGIGTGDHHAQLHAAAHKSAGGDAIKLDELAAPTDITTLDASTTLHGLLLKLGGGTTNFLRADGTWSAPGGGGSDISVRVRHSVDQSITDTTWTVLAFNTEAFDTDTMHDNVTNNSRLTATTAGKYLIIGLVEWQANVTGVRGFRITKNGTTIIAAANGLPNSAADDHQRHISTIIDMAATDYVTLSVLQKSGGALNVQGNSVYTPVFSMIKILG